MTTEARSDGSMSDAEPHEPEETRAVRVADPNLSADANQRLTEAVRDVVGVDHVRVPVDRAHPSRGQGTESGAIRAILSTNRILLLMTLVAALIVGAIATLATGSWWFLPLALVVHALGTIVVVGYIMRLTNVTERPHPTTVALLEEEGIRNPEQHFSDLVDEFTEPNDADDGSGERTSEAHQQPSHAASEQRAAMTPTSGPSQSVGPGSDD